MNLTTLRMENVQRNQIKWNYCNLNLSLLLYFKGCHQVCDWCGETANKSAFRIEQVKIIIALFYDFYRKTLEEKMKHVGNVIADLFTKLNSLGAPHFHSHVKLCTPQRQRDKQNKVFACTFRQRYLPLLAFHWRWSQSQQNSHNVGRCRDACARWMWKKFYCDGKTIKLWSHWCELLSVP